MWTHKNSKDKYWVVSQQALFFNAFLARHDDFNDAHTKTRIEAQGEHHIAREKHI